MPEALKQTWWAPLAGLLITGHVIVAVAFLVSGDDAENKIVGAAIASVGALVLAAGLWKRLSSRWLGNALIIVGALLAGLWFWTLFMPLLAIVVVVGLVISELSRSRTPATH